MAENVAPGATGDGNADSTRGLPYYEKLRRDLRDMLQKKRLLDKNMANLEDSIFRFEGSYLEETTAGNIIKGFDNYIKGSSTGGGSSSNALGARRKAAVSDADRVFSRSSASFMKDEDAQSSAQTTPASHAPTPNSSFAGPQSASTPTASGNTKTGTQKKKKAQEKDDEDEGKAPKRMKISYGRD